MGAANSGLSADVMIPQITVDELQALLNVSHYSEEEIHQLYVQFIAEAPSGVVSRSTFEVLAAALGVIDPVIANLLFNAFDGNADGMVSFHEFIRGMSVMTRGTTDEKLQFSFRMYDVHRLGVLSRETTLSIATSLLTSFRPAGPNGDAYSPEGLVDAMFANTSGRLTYSGFRDFALSNPAVVKGLALAPQPRA